MTTSMYTETQRFRQPWLWAILLLPFGFLLYTIIVGIYTQLIQGQPFGDKPMSDAGLIVYSVCMFMLVGGLFLLFLTARLEIQIDSQAIQFRLFPFHRSFKTVKKSEIAEFQVVTYKPIGDYGGWGIRFNRNGRAYNVRGNKGLQLRLKNGKQILLGTQQADRLTEFMQAWK